MPALALDDDHPVCRVESPAEFIGGHETTDPAAEDEDGPRSHQNVITLAAQVFIGGASQSIGRVAERWSSCRATALQVRYT